MVERKVQITNPLGLHARAAAQLVRLAASFECEITLAREDGTTANAKSILSVLNIAASAGTRLRVIADGTDEEDAIFAITDLVRRGFGEVDSNPFC